MKEIKENAKHASDFLKGLANESRLMILCELMQGEKSVNALIEATDIAQTSMSQHLNKLKEEKIVDFRRDHRTLYYHIINPHVYDIMAVLYTAFCKNNTEGEQQ